MSKCRFIALGDGQMYTTANELGHYLETRGLAFSTDDANSRHFGSAFNKVLCNMQKKNAQYWENFPYTVADYPKLITRDENGNNVIQNKRIVNILLTNFMCENSSAGAMEKGSELRGIDLYSIRAVRAIVAYYGSLYNINLVEEDISFIQYCDVVPCLVTTKRKELSRTTTQKKLLSV